MSTLNKLTKESKKSMNSSGESKLSLLDKIKMNELEYKLPMHVSDISLRNRRKFFFQQNSYNGGSTMLCDLQSSSFYVDPRNSYLVFSVELTGTEAGAHNARFGIGSAFNIIRSSVLTSRTGTELSRSDRVNLYRAKVDRFEKSDTWFKTVGRVAGYGTSTGGDYDNVMTVLDGQTTVTKEFCLPLHMVSPFFNIQNSSYLPPQICSGLRLEILLENINTAFKKDAGVTSYRIVDPALMLDLYKFSDKTDSVMTNVAHTASLPLVWNEYDIFSTVSSVANNLTLDIRKTASKASHAIGISRLSDNVSGANAATVDSFLSEDYKFTATQARYGSVYEPQSAISSVPEAYMNSLHLFRSKKAKHEIDVSPEDFETGGMGLIGVNLNRSQLYDHQTLVLNNSHSLSFQTSFDDSQSRQIDTFIVYTKLCKTFTNNSFVKE